MLLISPSPLTARWHSRPDSFQKEPNSLFVCRKAARLAWRVMSVSHAAVMEAEECQNVSSSSALPPLQIDDFSSESSDSIDSLEEPLKKKSKLKVKIKPKVCKTGIKVKKKKKKKKKFSTFCTECKTNEETLQKLVIHVNKWHKVSSMKVRLDFLVTF